MHFFISAFAIPTKRPWTEKRYQEIEPLQTEIQHDGDENIEDELFLLIWNSTYSQQQEFLNGITEMKNLEFILNGNLYLSDNDEYENYNDTYGSYESYGLSGRKSDINGNYADENKSFYFWALNSVENKVNGLIQHIEVITCFRGRVQDSGDFSGVFFDFREDRNMDSNEDLVFVAILVFVIIIIFEITLCCLKKKGRLKTKDEFKTKNPIRKNFMFEGQS